MLQVLRLHLGIGNNLFITQLVSTGERLVKIPLRELQFALDQIHFPYHQVDVNGEKFIARRDIILLGLEKHLSCFSYLAEVQFLSPNKIEA